MVIVFAFTFSSLARCCCCRYTDRWKVRAIKRRSREEIAENEACTVWYYKTHKIKEVVRGKNDVKHIKEPCCICCVSCKLRQNQESVALDFFCFLQWMHSLTTRSLSLELAKPLFQNRVTSQKRNKYWFCVSNTSCSFTYFRTQDLQKRLL